MSEQNVIPRNPDGTFPKGVSGNPEGRQKGTKNRLTILKQSLELQLREQAEGHMQAVLQKAIDLALEGDRTMLKLLIEAHLSKGTTEDVKGDGKATINIGVFDKPKEVIVAEPVEEIEHEHGSE